MTQSLDHDTKIIPDQIMQGGCEHLQCSQESTNPLQRLLVFSNSGSCKWEGIFIFPTDGTKHRLKARTGTMRAATPHLTREVQCCSSMKDTTAWIHVCADFLAVKTLSSGVRLLSKVQAINKRQSSVNLSGECLMQCRSELTSWTVKGLVTCLFLQALKTRLATKTNHKRMEFSPSFPS